MPGTEPGRGGRPRFKGDPRPGSRRQRDWSKERSGERSSSARRPPADRKPTDRPPVPAKRHPLAGLPLLARPAASDLPNTAETSAASPAARPDLPLDGEGRPYITLAQFLKSQQLASSGGQAKHLVREGGFFVNAQPEARPGCKLHAGDIVTGKDPATGKPVRLVVHLSI